MKIAVVGTACIGKTTFINDFLLKWPMYKLAVEGKKRIDEHSDIALNEEGNRESQLIIRDIKIDEAQSFSKDDNVIFDRCVLDNLVYTMWLASKEKGGVDDLFVEQQIQIVRETLKLYNIIFFIPILASFPVELVEKDETRSMNPTFRLEIDNIFKGLMKTYYQGIRNIFPRDDCPAVIEIFGKPEERIKMAEFYVNEDGTAYGEEDSLLAGATENPFDKLKTV